MKCSCQKKPTTTTRYIRAFTKRENQNYEGCSQCGKPTPQQQSDEEKIAAILKRIYG